MKIKGLIAAPFTAFDKNGDLNLGMVEVQARMYKKNGVKGVFICGTTGESSALTLQEKKALYKEWSKYKTPEFNIIAFLGGTCAAECIELSKYAFACGLDAVAVTAPYYFKPSSCSALADFCKEVALAVPEMPFYYYHIPCFTGVNYQMIDLLKCLDGVVPNFSGIKYTFENLMDYQLCLNFKNGKYDILWGRDEMLLPALSVGAQGAVGSTYGYMAPVYNRLIEAYNAGDISLAREMQIKAIEFIQLLSEYGGGTGKAFMREIGVECGEHRLPVNNLSEQQRMEFHEKLAKMQFTDYCCKL